MNPLFFGSAESPLFGVYHPPQKKSQDNHGVLVCPPLGTELLRSHRALRQVSAMLAKAGFPVLRFDYFGTGDSSGDCEDGRVARWVADAATAAQELSEMAGIDSISFVGLRLGATIAASASRQLNDDLALRKVILWDPVIDGKAYLDDQIAADLAYETHAGHNESVGAALRDNKTIGIMGFAMTPDLRADLTATTLETFAHIDASEVYLLVSQETADELALRNLLRSKPGKFGYEHSPIPGKWGEFDDIGSLLLPQSMMQGIVTCMM